MNVYRCTRDGCPLAGPRLTLDPRYATGFCRDCGKESIGRREEPNGVGPDHGQARAGDPATSAAAAYRIRPGSARAALLQAHAAHSERHAAGRVQAQGLTDEEACDMAGLSRASEYATRCSELMRAGLLVDTPETRVGDSGMSRLVRVITRAGLRVAEGLRP